jgi:hypothetical protein
MKSPSKNRETPRVMTVTPEDAAALLEANGSNRPLNDQHVRRIARQIIDGKWRFNGDTVKIASTNDILDGQHRLWAIIEAKIAVETIVVRGIEPDAFATIDTLRKPRSGSDILALLGATHHRSTISTGLQWLIRWQRKTLEDYRAPLNRLENSDVEQAYRDNPGITRAAERANRLRTLTNPGLLAFFYFVLTNRNPDLAERMMHTLENPAGVGINDPFFRLRAYFTHIGRKDPLTTIVLMIKAANAAHEGREIKLLNWRSQGSFAEVFPKLNVGQTDVNHR